MNNKQEGLEVATLGAGCFWCVEAIFQRLEGVYSVVSGYSNGHVQNPTYKQVCGGDTGHAEVAQITFDPSVITFEELLEVFWTTHDPTTLNRQGNDVGTQYRSGIYYHNETQKAIAEKSKKEVASSIWSGTITTEIEAIDNYSAAEDYHQNYFNQNSSQSYCAYVINPKVQKMKKKFAHKLKEEYKN
ncbi:MAG: peptide-methionine (S)-S-oxide reductase MsrA [Chitinophagales bacterium]